jgi:excisionase family DNA binding protein
MGIEEKLDLILAKQDLILVKLDQPPALINPELEEMHLTTAQAAQLLNIQDQTVILYIRDGRLKGGRNGKSFFTTYSAIKEYRKSRLELVSRNND